MSQLIVKRIFIASPGDLNVERDSFRKIISEINDHKAHKMGVHIEVIGWELVPPGLGRPQELINKLLTNLDLFVMVLWERWGTPSGKYSSGTEEEFYVAKNLYEQSGKPEMSLFFKHIDQITESNIEDCQKVIQFRKKIEENKELLYKSFTTLEEWERYIRDLINDWLGSISTTTSEVVLIEEHIKPLSERILIEISFVDRIYGNSRDEIYFTISDEQSLNDWKQLQDEDKKKLLYYYLSNYLYLNLGINTYKGLLRYRLDNSRYLILGIITFKYGSSFDDSYFYFPPDYHQTVSFMEREQSIIDLHMRFK